ncbi:MAG: chorismate-binding protein, partial [Clostridiales bacterium]
YIIEGDIYIANMTQQLLIRSHQTPFKAFLSLRRNNPSPFGGYLNYGCFKIISASPERFMKMHQNKIETRP